MTRRRVWWIGAATSTIAIAVGLYFVLDSGGANVYNAPHTIPFKAYSTADDALFAIRVAARMWDKAPKEIEVVSSTDTRALRVISPEEEVIDENIGDVNVRVFVIHGKFTALRRGPAGTGPPPKGTWLTFAIDESTGQLLDLSLTDQRPKLALLGKFSAWGKV